MIRAADSPIWAGRLGRIGVDWWAAIVVGVIVLLAVAVIGLVVVAAVSLGLVLLTSRGLHWGVGAR
ncbi:MAG: hypothetical protein WB777_22020 [Mycobacterium sp.]